MLETLPENVVTNLAKFPGPLTLHPSMRKWGLILLGMTCVVALGAVFLFLFITDGGAIFLVAGALSVFYGGFVSLGVALALAARRVWLRLDADGFECCFPGKNARKSWRNVDEFGATPAGYWTYVTYSDDEPAKWWHLNRNIYFGGRAWLPDTFGLDARHLAALMNGWRARALTGRD